MTTTNELNDSEVLCTLQLAYRWGYPLMAMATNNRETYGSTTNAFYHMKTAADDKSQRDKGFNAATLVAAGTIDLSQEPLVFSVPQVRDRYIVFPVQGAWGNIDNGIGTRTEGNADRNYLISGPGWKGSVPRGMNLQADSPGPDKEHNWLPTPHNVCFCILGVYGPEDDIPTGKWRIPDATQAS